MKVLAGTGRQFLRRGRRSLRHIVMALILVGLLSGTLPPLQAPPARAQCYTCGCVAVQHAIMRGVIVYQHIATRTHITLEFELHRYLFVIDYWFRLFVLKAMMMMTEQLNAVALQQMNILGTFFDAKEQLEAQRQFDELKADAHRDYQPSMDMCVFGTQTRSLAASQRRGALTTAVLNQRFIDRQLNSRDVNGSKGAQQDIDGRMVLFLSTFCDFRDNNDRLQEICETEPSGTAFRARHANQDIDFGRTVDAHMTLAADFSTPTSGGDQERDELAIMALASNLYNHNIFDPLDGAKLAIAGNRVYYMDARAIAAKRSVAQNSYNVIVGQKVWGSEDSEDTRAFMAVIAEQLGLEDETEIEAYLGQRPSYNAQMEVLTKMLYQRPEFYTNLYDTEANVARKQASMRAIGLMQNFDMFKSRIRNEALTAVLLEMAVEEENKTILDDRGQIAKEGPQRPPIDN